MVVGKEFLSVHLVIQPVNWNIKVEIRNYFKVQLNEIVLTRIMLAFLFPSISIPLVVST